ncbi:hypothetical protein ACWENA_31760 [Streptomyces sp. NPDC004779]
MTTTTPTTTGHHGFGATLGRLLDHRGLGARDAAGRAGVTEDEFRAVLAGETPGDALLRRLGPALGFHAVDLFVLAGQPVPDDLAPLDAEAASSVTSMVTDTARLPEAQRKGVLDLARALPQEERRAAFAPKIHAPLVDGPGGWVVRMFLHRNLDWRGIAHALAYVTPTYLSPPTYGVIGAGGKELTPHLVTDCAAVLDIDARELAVITGVVLDRPPTPPSPEARDAAALVWEARRLSAGQVHHVSEAARMLREDHQDGER